MQTEPEGHSSLGVDLVPIIGRIRLTVTPSDAEVLVNGRRVGTGSQTLELTARGHKLTVRKPDSRRSTSRSGRGKARISRWISVC